MVWVTVNQKVRDDLYSRFEVKIAKPIGFINIEIFLFTEKPNEYKYDRE